jgi:dihydroxyacid dehydratase/phosphogluconate dehydratase
VLQSVTPTDQKVDSDLLALTEAGAMPLVIRLPTITDGIVMGTEGMKYSLVSREVIPDSIEVAVNGQIMDGVLCVGGCDKNMPGNMMAMAINGPGIFAYGGTFNPGFWKGQKVTIASPFEAVGAIAAGKLSKEDYDGIERNACPLARRRGKWRPPAPRYQAVYSQSARGSYQRRARARSWIVRTDVADTRSRSALTGRQTM